MMAALRAMWAPAASHCSSTPQYHPWYRLDCALRRCSTCIQRSNAVHFVNVIWGASATANPVGKKPKPFVTRTIVFYARRSAIGTARNDRSGWPTF
jgi:hypothetical protein